MQSSNNHHQLPPDEGDNRRNRFTNTPDERDRAEHRGASQAPHNNGHAQQNLMSPSPSQQQQHIPPWSTQQQQQQRTSSALKPTSRPMPMPQSVPHHTRSSSFSAQSPSQFSTAMRDARSFAPTYETFEDEDDDVRDEDDDRAYGLEDAGTYDERYYPPQGQAQFRGRPYASEITRSRSQSLATTTRPGPIGSPLQSSALWESSAVGSTPLSIPTAGSGRYGDIKPPGSSRYGSLGATMSNTNHGSFLSQSQSSNGYSPNNGTGDISNMSPFVRDVGQILVDDGSAFWAGMKNVPRDENGGGGSGTASRRHSVSVVQPRRGPQIVGFNVGGGDGGRAGAEDSRPFHTQTFGLVGRGRGGLMLSDDDLASDLGSLSLNPNDGPVSSSSSSLTYGHHPPSQPASLPIYAPLSRSPAGTGVSVSSDRLSPYQPINLAIPSSGGGSGSSFASSSRYQQQPIGSPSESGLSAGSPSNHSNIDVDPSYAGAVGGQGQLTARFIPGQGIQYLPQSQANGIPYSTTRVAGYAGSGLATSPTATRAIHPQQPPYYSQQLQPIQRRSSLDAPQTPLTELGKGVPLHSVPASWPLYIVEFKAGRTDLFYLTDLSLDIRVGDLVIVEADRGKDLGKVVNDSITLKEVEEFQKEQIARGGYGEGGPVSPGGASGSGGTGSGGVAGTAKKEINPKMIYGKAQGQDTQLLLAKIQDEVKALQLCQSKVRQKKLPMEVIDAEYQWDRRKLTFYFVAEKRIDFRELVRELFRLYKTRIWMASLQGPTYDQ